MTPYCALIGCVTELATLITPECDNRFHLCTSILTSVVLAMVGPGAYSIDACIFGRRLVKFSRQEKINLTKPVGRACLAMQIVIIV
jgi:hypothetical protein